MNERGKIKILGYTICFSIVLIGVTLSFLAWATPGLNILLSMAGGAITGIGMVETYKLRKLFRKEDNK